MRWVCSMPQICMSKSISLLYLIVCSAGVGIGVVGFLEAGIGFVQCWQVARQATQPASKHNASTKKTIGSKIYSSKTNNLMQSFAIILHQLRPRPTRFLDPVSRSGHETQGPGPHWVPGGPGFLESWNRRDQVLRKVEDRPGLF